jgi:hypothetical protein
MIVSAELEQAGMEVDGVTATLQDDTLHVVVERDSGHAGPRLEGMHMPAQEIFQGLIEEKLQVERARIRQGDQKTREAPASTTDLYFAEMSPVGLGLLPGKESESQECFSLHRAQAGYQAPQLHNASGIAAIADHLENTGGPQSGIALQSRSHELDVGIGQARTQSGLATGQAVLQSTTHGVGMNTELPSDRANFPVFGIEPVTNLSLRFQIEHPAPPLQRYGLTNRPCRPQTMQRSQPENHDERLSRRLGL